MKWEKAIKQIETGLNAGRKIEIEYHRKWMTVDRHFDIVEAVVEYEYNGEPRKAVTTWADGLDESTHIIDEIVVK